jgi:hydroxyquinol 1,2-dioxygenase
MAEKSASESFGNIAAELSARLNLGFADTSAQRIAMLIEGVHALVVLARPSEAELQSALRFFNEVGLYSDAQRQEWVLLADTLGVSALVRQLNQTYQTCTPEALVGPFYRSDAPLLPRGASISMDGKGEPLHVSGTVTWPDGSPIANALVEVWHANNHGVYENQEPDVQPEFNLRGQFKSDRSGRFHFITIRPKGYFLPEDGPVGHLFKMFGQRLQRPAHLGFRVSAKTAQTVTTSFFDRSDPVVARDALFAVKPELLVDIASIDNVLTTTISIVLAKASNQTHQMPEVLRHDVLRHEVLRHE